MKPIKRKTAYWCIAFILFYLLFLVVSIPITIIQDKIQEHLLPYNVKIEKLEGSLYQGSIYLDNQYRPASIYWNICYINLLNPLGVCVNTEIAEINVNLDIPLSALFTNNKKIYNLELNGELKNFTALNIVKINPIIKSIEGRLNANIDYIELGGIPNETVIQDWNGVFNIEEISVYAYTLGNYKSVLTVDAGLPNIQVVGGNKENGIEIDANIELNNTKYLLEINLSSIDPVIASSLSLFTKPKGNHKYFFSRSGTLPWIN
jgi:hypothetical protein